MGVLTAQKPAKGIPCFLKVYVGPLYFYERPPLVPVFINQKKCEEDFHFYENRHKAELGVLQRALTEAEYPEQ